MIGYGIPLLPWEELTCYSGSGADGEVDYEWEKGYLFDWEGWGLVVPITDERYLKWNDIYLTIRARKIQRWVRSFEELPPCCPCPE